MNKIFLVAFALYSVLLVNFLTFFLGLFKMTYLDNSGSLPVENLENIALLLHLALIVLFTVILIGLWKRKRWVIKLALVFAILSIPSLPLFPWSDNFEVVEIFPIIGAMLLYFNRDYYSQ